MTTVLIIIHVLVAVFLVLIVLLQAGKGASMGAAFGGSSQTVFGPRGGTTLLHKLTTGAAIVFMITSLTLAAFSTKRGGSIMPEAPPAGQQQTTTPSAPPAPTPQPAPAGSPESPAAK
jgi:preprotein translocase subunit SecG